VDVPTPIVRPSLKAKLVTAGSPDTLKKHYKNSLNEKANAFKT